MGQVLARVGGLGMLVMGVWIAFAGLSGATLAFSVASVLIAGSGIAFVVADRAQVGVELSSERDIWGRRKPIRR